MAPTAGWTSSTEGALTRVVVGRVVGAHGLRGQVKVRAFADGPQTLLALPRVTLSEADQDAAAGPGYEIESAAPGRPGEVRLALEGIGDRAAAEALKGQFVWADSAHLTPLEAGEYYGYQLEGCRVEDSAGAPIGIVRGVWSTGPSDLLVIEDPAGREQLIPSNPEFVKEVDVDAGRIVVELVPGLIHPAPDAGRDEEQGRKRKGK